MKCPKCHYLGFETGERCKNCGYDFSLLLDAAADESHPLGAPDTAPSVSVDSFRRVGDEVHELPDLALRAEPPVEAEPALPLFRDDQADDVPLVTVGTPRPPVAVRRTPEVQRTRLTSSPPPPKPRASMQESVFEFALEDAASQAAPDPVSNELPDPSWQLATPGTSASVSASSVSPASTRETRPARQAPPALPAPMALAALRLRLVAALVDFGLLLAIDVVVVHFTLRVAALDWADLRMLPLAPLATFLLGLKVAYLTTFTFSGGQTIGKMATGLQVVADDQTPVTGWQALRRAVVELASVVAVGLPFALALRDPNRRGLHDRLARTRVVPSATPS